MSELRDAIQALIKPMIEWHMDGTYRCTRCGGCGTSEDTVDHRKENKYIGTCPVEIAQAALAAHEAEYAALVDAVRMLNDACAKALAFLEGMSCLDPKITDPLMDDLGEAMWWAKTAQDPAALAEYKATDAAAR